MAKNMENVENCYTCEHVFGNKTEGEVKYDKPEPGIYMCLNCHLVERKAKGKGNVKRILQQCGCCQGNSSGESDSTPAWFCYDCHQYLCSACQQEHDNHVS